jgi:hypothetical protein
MKVYKGVNINPLTNKKPNVKSRSKLDIPPIRKEGWEKEFDNLFGPKRDKMVGSSKARSFIRSLLHSQRAEIIEEIRKRAIEISDEHCRRKDDSFFGEKSILLAIKEKLSAKP